jgi:hypothetical protein
MICRVLTPWGRVGLAVGGLGLGALVLGLTRGVSTLLARLDCCLSLAAA